MYIYNNNHNNNDDDINVIILVIIFVLFLQRSFKKIYEKLHVAEWKIIQHRKKCKFTLAIISFSNISPLVIVC